MSRALIEKLQRARERTLTVGRWGFTIRRPTDAEAIQMQGREPVEFVRRFVVGWDLTEVDVVPGGGPERVPFSADLWAVWVDDHPELWLPIATAVLQDFQQHVEAREAAEKN